MNNNKGFTLVELTVVMIILGILSTLVISKTNISSIVADNVKTQLLTLFVNVETNVNYYNEIKGQYPSGMNDTSFVPTIFMPPQVPTGFDATYGTNGIALATQTGQTAGENGRYIALKTTVNGTDNIWNGIKETADREPLYKFYYNTSAPAVSNMAAPSGSTTIYLTYWIYRN